MQKNGHVFKFEMGAPAGVFFFWWGVGRKLTIIHSTNIQHITEWLAMLQILRSELRVP